MKSIEATKSTTIVTEAKEDPHLHFMQHATLGIPYDSQVRNTYTVYRTSLETKLLKSEQDQTIRADAFIEPDRLGPLSMLSVAALAQTMLPHELLDMVRDNPFQMQYYYDMLSVDLPLEKCYDIDSERYWRRVVLEKTKNCSLTKTKQNWKNYGITLKFVEHIESIPPIYYNEEDIHALSVKIRDYIIDMHIAHLQPINEGMYIEALKSKLDPDFILSSSSISGSTISTTTEPSEESIEEGFGEEVTEECESEYGEELDDRIQEEEVKLRGDNWRHNLQKEQKKIRFERKKMLIRNSNLSAERLRIRLEEVEKAKAMKSQLRAKYREKLGRREMRTEKQLMLEAKDEQLEKERILEEQKLKDAMNRNLKPKGRGKNKDPDDIKSVFEFAVEPEKKDVFIHTLDLRNQEEYYKFRKGFNTINLDDYCIHFNLCFVRFFPFLETLSLEFAGPRDQEEYNERYLLFATKDMEHLAYGITFLHNLKTFRFCNSKTTTAKLHILTKALKQLNAIENISFRNDFLNDDCGDAVFELFQGTTTIQSLELGYNSLSTNTLQRLGEALKKYKGCLVYLGLDGNPLGDKALHALNGSILSTPQIRKLSLRSVSITQEAIICCITRELLTMHTGLESLDMSGVAINSLSATKLHTALNMNLHIKKLDVRDCDLDLDMELELEKMVKRNRFFHDNPFIGDSRKTKEQIDSLVARVKNPIMVRALENVEKRAKCLASRPDEELRYSSQPEIKTETEIKTEITSEKSSKHSFPTLELNDYDHYDSTRYNENANDDVSLSNEPSSAEPFVYEPNNFDTLDILKHVKGGDESRFTYMRSKRNSVKYDIDLGEYV